LTFLPLLNVTVFWDDDSFSVSSVSASTFEEFEENCY
jgi:hypothetical protein